MLELYDYQERAIDDIRREFRNGKRKIIYQLPTGGGKTIVMGFMAKSAAERGRRTWFVVHRKELLDQAMDKLKSLDVPYGQIKSGCKIVDAPVKVVMVQSVKSKLEAIKEAGFEPHNIIFDECHHCAAGSYKKIMEAFPDATVIGLSATPERMGGKGLGSVGFESLICGPTTKELIERKFLSPYRIFVPPNNIHLERVRMDNRKGDYNLKDLAEEMEVDGKLPKLAGDSLEHYLEHLRDKRALGFTINVTHAIKMAEFYNSNGVPADYVDGTLSKRERGARLEAFANGEILALFSCDLIGEGYDVPSCEGAMLLRPTKSKILYLQQCGRALRRDPNNPDKVAIIIDHANNSDIHDLPDDPQYWTLEDKKIRRKKKKDDDDISVFRLKTCPKCFLKTAISTTVCDYCKHVFEVLPGKTPDSSDTKLIEINPEQVRKDRELLFKQYSKCQSLDEFKTLAIALKYKPGWAWIQWRAYEVLKKAPYYKDSFLGASEISKLTKLRLDSIEKVLVELERRGRLSDVPSAIINNVKCYKGDLILSIWANRTIAIGAGSVKKTHRFTKQNDSSFA